MGVISRTGFGGRRFSTKPQKTVNKNMRAALSEAVLLRRTGRGGATCQSGNPIVSAIAAAFAEDVAVARPHCRQCRCGIGALREAMSVWLAAATSSPRSVAAKYTELPIGRGPCLRGALAQGEAPARTDASVARAVHQELDSASLLDQPTAQAYESICRHEAGHSRPDNRTMFVEARRSDMRAMTLHSVGQSRGQPRFPTQTVSGQVCVSRDVVSAFQPELPLRRCGWSLATQRGVALK